MFCADVAGVVQGGRRVGSGEEELRRQMSLLRAATTTRIDEQVTLTSTNLAQDMSKTSFTYIKVYCVTKLRNRQIFVYDENMACQNS